MTDLERLMAELDKALVDNRFAESCVGIDTPTYDEIMGWFEERQLMLTGDRFMYSDETKEEYAEWKKNEGRTI